MLRLRPGLGDDVMLLVQRGGGGARAEAVGGAERGGLARGSRARSEGAPGDALLRAAWRGVRGCGAGLSLGGSRWLRGSPPQRPCPPLQLGAARRLCQAPLAQTRVERWRRIWTQVSPCRLQLLMPAPRRLLLQWSLRLPSPAEQPHPGTGPGHQGKRVRTGEVLVGLIGFRAFFLFELT